MKNRITSCTILLVTLFPLFLGADYERWVHGLVLCAMGALFLLSPPRHPRGHGIGWVALALFAVSLTAFLPARWFGIPAWRTEVTGQLGIALPGTLSPQPWLSVDYILLLGAGLLWMYYLAARGWTRDERRFAMRALGVCLVAFTITSLAFFLAQSTPHFWEGRNHFGPIANRNQMALVLCMTAVVLIGCAEHDFVRKHRYRAFFWAAGVPLVFAGLVVNYSRAGVLLFFAGLGIWIAATALQKRSLGLLSVGGSCLLLFAAAFFLYGGPTLKRFTQKNDEIVSSVKAEGRLEIYENSLSLVAEAPVFGLGFGNFAPVYALHYDPQKYSITARVAQPENDLIWLATETGLAGLCLALVLVVLLAKRAFPLGSGSGKSRRSRSTTPLKLGALIAVALFFVDSLVNVPAHRMAVVLLGLLLFSLALRTNHRTDKNRSYFPLAAIYRFGGLALLAVGLSWIAATFFKLPLPGLVGIENLEEKASDAVEDDRYQDAYDFINHAIRFQPLRYRHYYKRAVYGAEIGVPLDEVVADFAVARTLAPTHPVVPLGEAEFWLELRPVFAIPAIEDAMRRLPGVAPHYFRRFSSRSGIDPLFQRALGDLALKDPQWQIVFFSTVPQKLIASQLDRILARDPHLEEWNHQHKKTLFGTWYRFGDREQLVSRIADRRDWEAAGWQQLCRHFAANRDFKGALNLAWKYLTAPTLPRLNETRSLEDLRTSSATNPGDVSIGVRLHHAEAKYGNDDAALFTLQKVAQLPDCPDYVFYMLARAHEKRNEFEEAWNNLQIYIKKNPPL